jgi:tetratricopeptide (TPR) repeat protein
VVISAVSGTAGVGKTALAVHWAHRVRGRFPDGQLYLDLRGFGPADQVVTPGDAVRRLLEALQVPPHRLPTTVGAQTDLYRTLLADRSLLIVLDNARDADQVRPLLPGAPGCVVLVTSRDQLTSLVAVDGAQHVAVNLLSPAEARELLIRRLGPARVAAEPAAVADVIARCAHLPLALAIVAARAATHPQLPLATLAGELGDTRQHLDALAEDDPHADVRAVFSWSYRTLSPAAARLFRLLGLHPGPDISAAAAASLAALPPSQTRPLLVELTRANLVAKVGPGRYGVHDLLHAYAAELTRTDDTDAGREAARRRLLDHYLHTAYGAAQLLDPHEKPISPAAARAGTIPELVADPGQALAWMAAEYRVLLAVMEYASAIGFAEDTFRLAWYLWVFLQPQGRWHDVIRTESAALAAARTLTDVPKQATAHRALGIVLARLGHYEDAHRELKSALTLLDGVGDHASEAGAYRTLAWVAERQDNYGAAVGYAQQALDLHRRISDPGGQANLLSRLAWYHARLGDPGRALAATAQARAVQESDGSHYYDGDTWSGLGNTYRLLGHYDEAADCLLRAIQVHRDTGHRYDEADAHGRLGDTYDANGDPAAAAAHWQRAIDILAELDHPDADRIRDRINSGGSQSTPQRVC